MPNHQETGTGPLKATGGRLILNADDWGQDRETRERILECIQRGAVSSVSAMVWMEDSERAATVARERGIDAGLHLNFTTPFSSVACPARLRECQKNVAAHLRSPWARGIFHPLLIRSFEYLVAAQRDEFHRLYGAEATRFDGHHHMHLAANVLLGGLLPPGSVVRQHFSYEAGEKPVRNCIFRKVTGILVSHRYRVADFFFSLPPFHPAARLQRIFSLASHSVVEVETHPVNAEEYRFLCEGEILRWTRGCPIATSYCV